MKTQTLQFTKLLATLCVLLLMGLIAVASPNEMTQEVHGQVIDKATQLPLPGVTVTVLNTSPLLGAATDERGFFKITNVPLGRQTVQFSFIGYKPITLNNINIQTGKQTVLNIEMEEQVSELQEVKVTATNKSESLNKMASVSARTFSVEESDRYAGSMGDPARMAMNFAGVRSNNDGVNDIVIRGNSPNGLLWRMEGVDILNPNHYGDGSAAGGPVSMINNNCLANSDFMTGAFPAEYGNGLSGVFDLKLRNGNTEKFEALGQVGFNGFEAGLEGPLSRKNKGSFMINYRYSTLALVSKLGFDMGTGTGVPYYQDVIGKINLPTERCGTFSLFWLGGKSNIEFINSKRDTTKEFKDLYGTGDADVYNKNNYGLIGASHRYHFSTNTYSNLTVAASQTMNSNVVDTVIPGQKPLTAVNFYAGTYKRYKVQTALYVNTRLDKKNSLRVGAYIDYLGFNMADSLRHPNQAYESYTNFSGNTMLIRPFASWQYKPTDRMTVTSGVYSQYLAYNGTKTVEPRVGIRYQLTARDRVSLASGMHSQMTGFNNYVLDVKNDSNKQTSKPNKDIDFQKSVHVVLGYDRNLTEKVRFKAETYYQYVYDALIGAPSLGSFSMLNSGSFSQYDFDTLVNKGTGRNIGVEFTLEQFMDHGFYYLTTLSLFDSKYKGADGVERNTAFNGRFVYNALIGKEFVLNAAKTEAKSRNSLTIDLKGTYAGGQYYTPVDLDESRRTEKTKYDFTQAYSKKMGDYVRFDVRIGFRMSRKKYTQEWAINFQNVTNHENPYSYRYNRTSDKVELTTQQGLIVMPMYRLTF